jgi:MFS family permease
MILLTFTPGIKWLISVRILQGAGGAMMFGTNMAILTSVFPPGERGRAMGINVTAVYAGLASGPFLGGILTRYLGWRSIFAFLVPMGIISLILIRRKMKEEWADAKGESFDWTGAVVYGLAIAGFMSASRSCHPCRDGSLLPPDWPLCLFSSCGKKERPTPSLI